MVVVSRPQPQFNQRFGQWRIGGDDVGQRRQRVVPLSIGDGDADTFDHCFPATVGCANPRAGMHALAQGVRHRVGAGLHDRSIDGHIGNQVGSAAAFGRQQPELVAAVLFGCSHALSVLGRLLVELLNHTLPHSLRYCKFYDEGRSQAPDVSRRS